MNNLFIFLIDVWRFFISPLYSWTNCCRYNPSCSEYAKQAYSKYSFLYATKLTIFRMLRCNPFSKGGHDPC